MRGLLKLMQSSATQLIKVANNSSCSKLVAVSVLFSFFSQSALAAINWGYKPTDPITVNKNHVFYIQLTGVDAQNYTSVNSSNTTNCSLGTVTNQNDFVVIPVKTRNSNNRSCTITLSFGKNSQSQNYRTNSSSGSSDPRTLLWRIKPTQQIVGDSNTLQAVAYRGLNTQSPSITYASNTTSVCTINAKNEVVAKSKGVCTVTASANQYTSISSSWNVSLLPTEIEWKNEPTPTKLSALAVFKPDGNSGGIINYEGEPGVCTVNSQGEINYLEEGHGKKCTVKASVEATKTHDSSNEITTSVGPETPKLDWVKQPSVVDLTFEAELLVGIGQSIQYAVTNSSDCTIQGNSLVFNSSGSCAVTASVEALGPYGTASIESQAISRKVQHISYTIDLEPVIEGQPFKVLATRHDGPNTDIKISAYSGACSFESEDGDYALKEAKFNTSGDNCQIIITSSEQGAWLAYDSGPINIPIEALYQEQTIIHTPPTFDGLSFGQILTVTASTDKGESVYMDIAGSSCILNDFDFDADETEELIADIIEINLLKAGSCTINFEAEEWTDDRGITYITAEKTIRFNVDKWAQIINVDIPPPGSQRANTSFVVKAHNEYNNPVELAEGVTIPALPPVTIEVGAGSACTVSNEQVTEPDSDSGEVFSYTTALIQMHEEGQNCIVYFKQGGDLNYKPASSISHVVTLAQQLGDDGDIGDYWTHYALFEADNGQAITSPPMVARDGEVKAREPNLMVIFGTGMYHQVADLSDEEKNKVQSIYGVHDRGVAERKRSNLEKRTFNETSVTNNLTGESQKNRKISGNDINWAQKYGWYIDLLGGANGTVKQGERSVFRPFLSNQLFVFNTVIPVSGSCEGATQGWTMLIDWATGKAPDFATYDANMDGLIDKDGDMGFVGYFNEIAGSELGRSGDNIFDSSGSEARVRTVIFGATYDGVRIGWEEKRPFGVRSRND